MAITVKTTNVPLNSFSGNVWFRSFPLTSFSFLSLCFDLNEDLKVLVIYIEDKSRLSKFLLVRRCHRKFENFIISWPGGCLNCGFISDRAWEQFYLKK